MKQQELTEYAARLYAVAVKKIGDPYTAEDIVQETFLAALYAMKDGKQPDDLWHWLLRVLSNKYCDWLREKYGRPYISIEDYPVEIPDARQLDDDSAQMLEDIRRMLGYLSKTHREVMVRFYMHGQTLEEIAQALELPVGTVKSRLHTGRRQVKEGVTAMENYTKQSYEPDRLSIACSGEIGLHGEPFSLVDYEDLLSQNVLLLAYRKPVTETELAKALGVPVPFIEPIVKKMIHGELMRRTEGGKVYTDFIIYTDADRKATLAKQIEAVEKHFDVFWAGTEAALAALREKPYYIRQTASARAKLELHFAVKLLMNAHIGVRDLVTGNMPYSEYPYRDGGGRWFAMGMHYAADHDSDSDQVLFRYGVSGEAGLRVQNFRDTKQLDLRKYDTSYARTPSLFHDTEYVKWLYEIHTGVPREDSAVADRVLQTAGELIDCGVLRQDGGLALDIPVLTFQEGCEYHALGSAYNEALAADIREVLLPVFESGYVKLPPHLKSVPKWQQYMYCGDSVPMIVLDTARKKGLFLQGVEDPLPAAMLIYEKAE